MSDNQSISSSSIKWNEITWYSRLGAIILFLAIIPALSFYIGTQYELAMTAEAQGAIVSGSTENPTPNLQQIYFSDRTNFETGYEKDATHVYYMGSIIPGADPNSFVVFDSINEAYGKDANNVYFGTSTVQGADAATFSAFDIYGTDTRAVYLEGKVIPDADPKTFVDLNENYSKDAHNVYYQYQIIPGADPNTIQVISDYEYAKDKNHVYDWGKVMTGVNPATFTPPLPG